MAKAKAKKPKPKAAKQPAKQQAPGQMNTQGFHANPVSNPTHPAHAMASRHFGAALGHALVGNGEMAAHHIGQALGHVFAPHMPEQVGSQVTQNIRTTAHGKVQ